MRLASGGQRALFKMIRGRSPTHEFQFTSAPLLAAVGLLVGQLIPAGLFALE
jgi:hypothetical protein